MLIHKKDPIFILFGKKLKILINHFMKIAIIGVGAIGGYVGIRLARAGEDVTFIARGANLEALRTRGIRMLNANGTEEVVPRVKATDDYAEAGPQDIADLGLDREFTGRGDTFVALRCQTLAPRSQDALGHLFHAHEQVNSAGGDGAVGHVGILRA